MVARRYSPVLVVLALLLGLAGSWMAGHPMHAQSMAPMERLLVARADGVVDLSSLHAAHGLRVVGGIESLGVDFLRPVEGTVWSHRRLAQAVERYEASGLVRWVEVEQRWHVEHPRSVSQRLGVMSTRALGALATPNDPRFGLQWHLAKMRVPEAWDRARAYGVVIAVVDTGVECTHPDLAAACVDGWNVVDGNDDTTDKHRHGTIEAGAAAAVVDNGKGVAGVAWGAKVMPIKAMGDDGSGQTGDIAAGIVWAAENGAHVINMSLGGESGSQVMADAVDLAVARGAFLAASAGNTPTGRPLYPAAYGGVVGVGATTRDDRRPDFGNFGAHVVLSAPGVSILTTDLGGGYAPHDGTSESTALVAGAAALLLGQEPGRTADEVRALLMTTAVDLGPAGRDDEFGHGRVDVGGAVEAGEPEEDPEPEPGDTCERGWTLSLKAFPDVSGRVRTGWPPRGADCPGCDGVFSSADRRAGALEPLGPLRIVISPAVEPAARIAEIDMDGHGTAYGAAEAHIALCFPPPYRVALETVAVDGYTLCERSAAEVLLSQTNFDRARSSRKGQGRWAEVTWGFQRCTP